MFGRRWAGLSWLVVATLCFPATSLAQTVSSREFGHLADGRAVHEFQLDSGNGLRVRLLDYGGIIRAIEVPDRDGHVDNVALSLDQLASYEKRPNFGAIIGRYVNRLSGGGFSVGGVFHKLAANERGIISHGGPDGFGAQLWEAIVVPMPGRAAVMLHLVSPAGENGFPGTLDTRVTFSVGRDRTLRLDYRATTDAATVVNLSHHVFFNLAGADSGSVDRQWIRIFADRFTPLDGQRLPTGEIRKVDGTSFDLRNWVEIGAQMRAPEPQIVASHGFDHNFVLRPEVADGKAVAACAYDPSSGRALLVRTDQPGLQLYTANGFDGTLRGGAGQMLRQGDGFALETQHFADAPRHPNFPSTELLPGQIYMTSTSFTFAIPRARRSNHNPSSLVKGPASTEHPVAIPPTLCAAVRR